MIAGSEENHLQMIFVSSVIGESLLTSLFTFFLISM